MKWSCLHQHSIFCVTCLLKYLLTSWTRFDLFFKKLCDFPFYGHKLNPESVTAESRFISGLFCGLLMCMKSLAISRLFFWVASECSPSTKFSSQLPCFWILYHSPGPFYLQFLWRDHSEDFTWRGRALGAGAACWVTVGASGCCSATFKTAGD